MIPRVRLCVRVWLGLLGASGVSLADPEREVSDAVSALARTSYAWETTVRQRFRGETAEPRLNPAAPIDVQGSIEPDGFMQVTLAPSRELPVSISAVFRLGDVVAQTPLGWLRRAELKETSGDRRVEVDGKTVRLSRLVNTALKATTVRPLAEELFDLVADVKSWREESGLILAELRDARIERLWGDAQARRAPEIQGTVIFKLAEGNLEEFHVMLAIGFPDRRTNGIAWSMQQRTTRISGIGATTVEPPEAAIAALERE